MRLKPLLPAFAVALLSTWLPASAGAQFDNIPIPAELQRLDFLLGEWDSDWAFRGPDSTAGGALWYRAAGGGVLRFDGKAWTAFRPGESSQADEVLAAIPADHSVALHHYSGSRSARHVQDGFAVLLDDGSTGGTSLLFYDPARGRWIDRSLHAPTSAWGREATGSLVDGRLVFEGTGSDRRGERIFRREYTLEGADGYSVHTDVSFDGGTTWIEDQMVQTVRRKRPLAEPVASQAQRTARAYLDALLRLDADAVATFYDAETVFEDAVLGTRLVGKATLLEEFAPSFASVRLHHVELLHEFSSGPFTFFVLGLAGEAQDSGQWVSFRASQATAVKIEGETVREHQDFIDYACWQAQKASQESGQIAWQDLPSCAGRGRVLRQDSP